MVKAILTMPSSQRNRVHPIPENPRVIHASRDIARPLFFVLFFALHAYSQLREAYIYKAEIPDGSMAVFSPFTALINGGFDILRNTYDTRIISNIQFSTGFKNVRDNLLHAPQVIDDYNRTPGHNFWKEQVFPMDFSSDRAPWVPNYQTHFIGEGLVCRQLAEWYANRNIAHPYALAVVNTAAFQVLNEVVEHSYMRGYTVDPIPDLLLFNPLGWVVFYFDTPARFFGKTLHFANWSLQPMFNPYNGVLTNAGEQFAIKADLPWTRKFQAFYGWGIDGTFGLSYQAANGLNWSYGCGLKARRLKASLERSQHLVYPELEPNFVYYLDRNESLLLSVNQTGIHEINLLINVYPGLVVPRAFGFYVGINTYLGLHCGISYTLFPLGLFAGR